MNASTENFTSLEVHSSTNLTTYEDLLLNGFRAGLLCLNLLFGVVTYSYVLWLIAQRRRISSEFFHFNLTVCDFIYTLSTLLKLLESVTHLGYHGFILLWFSQGLVITGRPLFQCLMCVERYLAVVHPVTFLKYKPFRYKVICCTVVWIITSVSGFCVLCIMIIIGSTNLKAYTWFLLLQFLLFLSIQLFCLVAVLRALKQSGPGERGKKREEENHIKRRAFCLILITAVTFIVMFAPFIFTGFLVVLKQADQMDFSLFWFLSHCCFILAAFLRPVLYLHQAGKLFCLCSLQTVN